jgi:nitrate reductase gamma subunit
MNGLDVEFLMWVRGPGLAITVGLFCLGMALRVIEILSLGHPVDLSSPRPPAERGSPLRTIWGRFFPFPGLLCKTPVVHMAGYLFHIGFFITLFLFAPHIELIHDLTGWRWPGLPHPVVDTAAIVTIVALIFLLINRRINPVRRFLSDREDYLIGVLSLLPPLTGFLAVHHAALPYTWMVGLHILSVELLIIAIPFTKLIHLFTLFAARWYTGDRFGRKGVQA